METTHARRHNRGFSKVLMNTSSPECTRSSWCPAVISPLQIVAIGVKSKEHPAPVLILPVYGPLAQNFFWTNFNTLSSSC